VSNVRYLSTEWIEAVGSRVTGSAEIQTLAKTHTVGITQVVTGTPFGDVTYNFQVGSGRATFTQGVASPEDVRFSESWETALAVNNDTMSPDEAILLGHVTFTGDHTKLVAAGEVFALLDSIFEEVRALTTFA
jgi:hypothetical protein